MNTAAVNRNFSVVIEEDNVQNSSKSEENTGAAWDDNGNDKEAGLPHVTNTAKEESPNQTACSPNEQVANSLNMNATITYTGDLPEPNDSSASNSSRRSSNAPAQELQHATCDTLSNSEMIHVTPTNISTPPKYSRFDELEKHHQQARYLSLHMARLKAFYRTNPGIVLHEYFNRGNTATDNPLLASLVSNLSGHQPTIGFRDALHACVLFQFTGFPITFWLLLLGFIGCLSFIVDEVPNLYLLLWTPLALYIGGVKFVQYKQKRWLARLEELESQVVEERSRRIMGFSSTAVDNTSSTDTEASTKDKYRNHYFIIMEDENHSHSVVTLIPPPPAYIKTNEE